jgi:hypothetical protein
MTHNIRPYKHSDYENIVSWWLSYNECPPVFGMMVEDGTFVLQLNNVPALSLTVFLTQSKEISYLEGFIKNPVFKDISLEDYDRLLWDHCFNYAKLRGYKRIVALCEEPKLFNKYKRLGMTEICSSLKSFTREL